MPPPIVYGTLGAFGGPPAREIWWRAIIRFSHAKVFGGEISFVLVWRALCGASDHRFSKYDGMKAIVFFTILFSVLFLDLSPEYDISLCSLSLS